MSDDLLSQQVGHWGSIVRTYDLNIHELLEKAMLATDEVILITELEPEGEKGLKILYANAAYYSLCKRPTSKNKRPQYFYDDFTPLDVRHFNSILTNLSLQEKVWADLQFEIHHKEQKIKLSMSPLSDVNHCFKAILFKQVHIQDLSESLPLKNSLYYPSNRKDSDKYTILQKNSWDLPGSNLQALINSLPGIVFACNHDVEWSKKSLSRGCLALTGYYPEELLENFSLTYNTLIDSDDFQNLLAEISSAIEKQEPYAVKYRIRTKSGQLKWFLEQGKGIFSKQSEVLGLEGFITDISELKQAESQLMRDAFYDKLTGLPNRALFMDRLEYCIKRAKRHQDQIFAVLFLDLDRFKVVNDSLGHAAGDQLLVEIASRLAVCLRESDTLARLGGDEFTILLEGIKDLSDALRVCHRIQQALNTPFNLNGREVLATVSTGVALSTMGYDDPEQLLHNADAAMYRAKALGKAQWEVFTTDMHSNASALLQLEVDLRRAIERHEFQLHYQPIYELETAEIVGFEALLRWHHPLQGLISPVEFIPIAEETGLILPISWWVLHEACRQLSQWQRQYESDSPLFVSVNFSSKQFSEVGLISRIERTLKETGLEPQNLKLEITESAIMENAASTAAKLLEIKALGIQLGIDDFGTGYSSLSYLHRFPVDILKIDRSFVSAMDNHENLQIVKTITMLSQNLGMQAVAEGVETAEQAAQLRAMRCRYAQGYFFSKPIDAIAIESLLQEHNQSKQEESMSLLLSRLKLRINAAFSYRPLVGQTSWIIGSRQGSDILLADSDIASKHAMLQLMGTGNYYLVNLSADDGVFVNGQLTARPTLLQDADRIMIGSTHLVFESQSTPLTKSDTTEQSVLMSHSLQLQGEIWQAALTSQGVSVTWQAADTDLMSTLEQMKVSGYALPDLLLIDKYTLLDGLDKFCLWCQTHYPEIRLVFTNGDQPQVAPSEHQRVIDYGAIDLLPGFSENNVLLNLVDTLAKINVVLQALEWQSLDRKSLMAALMPLQSVVKQGVFH